MRAIRPPIAISVLLLLGGSLYLLLWLVIVSPLSGSGDSADGRTWAAGVALRRALCVPPGVDVGDGAAAFHEREVQPRLSRSLILFDARCAASALARGSPSPLLCSGSRPGP